LVKLLLAIRKNTALDELPASSKTVAAVAAIATQNVMSNKRRQYQSVLPTDAGIGVSLPGSEVAELFHSFNGYATEAEGLPLQRLQQAFSGLNQYLDTLAESDNLRQVAFDVSRDSQGGGAA